MVVHRVVVPATWVRFPLGTPCESRCRQASVFTWDRGNHLRDFRVGIERRSGVRAAASTARRWLAKGPDEARKGEVGAEASDGEPRAEADSH